MLKIFQKYSFTAIYLCVFFTLLLWLGGFIGLWQFEFSHNSVQTPIYNWIENFLKDKNFLSRLMIFIFFVIEVILIISYSLKYEIFGKKTFIAGFVYILLSGFFYLQTLNPVIFANLFILIALGLLLKIVPEKKSYITVFNAGVIFAISSLFYYPYFLTIIFFPVAVLIIRSKFTKEFFVAIFSFVIFYVFYSEFFYFLTDEFFNINKIINSYFKNKSSLNLEMPEKIFVGYMALIFLISNIYIFRSISIKEIEKRTIFQLFFSFFVFGFMIFWLIPAIKIYFALYMFIPVTFLFGDFFANTKRTRYNKILFIFFILNPVIFQVLKILNLFE